MIAFYIPPEVGEQLLIPGGEKLDDLHLTLAYLGDAEELEDIERLKRCVAEYAARQYRIAGVIGGILRFSKVNADNTQAFCATFDSPDLPAFRNGLISDLVWRADIDEPRDYGFIPHVTLAYIPPTAAIPFPSLPVIPCTFDTLSLVIAGERYDYAMITESMMIETGKAGSLANQLKQAGATLSEIIGIYVNREDSSKYYVNFGDWATEETIKAVKEVLGEVESEAEAPPDEAQWKQIWPERKKRKAGARHSLSDNQKIQEIHDHACYLGAKCAEMPVASQKTTPDNALEGAPVPSTTPDAQTDPSTGRPPSPPLNPLKAIASTDDRLIVGNYLALWYGRDLEGVVNNNKNLDGSSGEFFTPQTKFESDYTATGRLYVDWEHGLGLDGLGKDDILGYVDWSTAKADNRGLWAERILNRRNRYVQMLETLIEAGLVGTSSEAVAEGIVKAANGEIVKWPLCRDTLTVSPMEPRMISENTVTALKTLARDVPAVKIACEKMGIDLGQKTRAAVLKLRAQQLQVQAEATTL